MACTYHYLTHNEQVKFIVHDVYGHGYVANYQNNTQRSVSIVDMSHSNNDEMAVTIVKYQ